MSRGSALCLSIFALFCAPALPAGAQSLPASSQPGSASARIAADNAYSSSAVTTTGASVTASGAPRSYQVISIPVPEALSQARHIEIVVTPRGDFQILGSRTRSIDVNPGRARIAVTVGVPAAAVAGKTIAAEVRFYATGSPILVVPVEIDVTLVRKIILRPAAGALNAQAGNDVILPFDIANAGNAVERVSTDVELPSGWASRDAHQSSLELAPGETIKRRLRLKVPPLSATGSSFVRVSLRSGQDTVASEMMTVEVFNSSSIGRQAGPLITSSVAQATDENGRASRLVSLSATGALYDSVRVDARFSEGTAFGGAASNAFAHLGAYQSSASVTLSAPSGQLSVGNTGTSFSDLTGLYPYGQGALLHLQHPDWSVLALGALSMASVGMTERKPMVGVRAERQFGVAQLSGSVSHLADAGLSPRRLDAAGIGAALPAPFGSTFKAEVAQRRFDSGDGLGWSSQLVRQRPESNEELRITHAPGGGDAFARATNELVANLSERVSSRSAVSVSAWRTSDVTSVFTGLKSNGYSLRPQYTLFGRTTMALEGRSYVFDATSRPTASGGGGGFGNREQQLGASLSTYLRQYYLNSSAYLGNVTRTVSPTGLPTVIDRTPRNYWTTNAGWSGVGGIIELQMRIEQTRDRGGFVNQQSLFGVRGEQVVLPWLGGVRAEGELQRVNGFGDERSAIVRAGFAIPLMNAFAIQIDAERNSIFRATSGRVPWVFGVRLEHALTVPMLRTPGTSGYVYQDLNGNQRRDPNEPGVPAAIVRRGAETAVADASGKYRVGGDIHQPISVDEASLPDGWSANGTGQNDLSVTLSTSAEIELVVAPRSGIAAVQVDLSKAHVIARDSAGREWGAVMTGPTTATFQSLPVGSYRLDFDLSELSEPLVPRGPLPVLNVTGKESKSITITLDPRPIRMWTPPSNKSGGQTSPSPVPAKSATPTESH
jgi:alpha-galactosidase-like protein